MNSSQNALKFKCSLFFFWKFLNRFVPGRAGTEEFVPGHLLLPLSRDNGTPGQEFFFVPGQRDNGTSRPGLSRDVPRDVPSLGNPNMKAFAHAACFNKWFSCSVTHTTCSVSSLLEFQEIGKAVVRFAWVLPSLSHYKNVVRSSYLHMYMERLKVEVVKKSRKSAFCLKSITVQSHYFSEQISADLSRSQ